MNTVLCPSTDMATAVIRWDHDMKALEDWSDGGLRFAESFYEQQILIEPHNPKWVEAAQAVTAELVYRKLAK